MTTSPSEDNPSAIPFNVLCRPIARRVIRNFFKGSVLITSGNDCCLEKEVARAVSEVLGPALYLQLHALRSVSSRQGSYERFAGGVDLPSFLEQMPHLQELMEKRARAVCSHLADLIRTANNLGATVQNIGSPIGDTHSGAKSVRRVRFEMGKTAIFKPRSVDPERRWSTFVESLRSIDQACGLAAPGVIASEPDCGWMEHIPHQPLKSLADAALFYHRAGALLFWAWLTNSTDLLGTNIIANGSQPFLVDAETVMGIRGCANLQDTGLLPVAQKTATGETCFYGGLALEPSRQFRMLRFQQIDEDGMCFDHFWVEERQSATPSYNGKGIPVGNYVSNVLEGYRQAFQLALRHRVRVSNLMCEIFREQNGCRVAFRPTVVYGALRTRHLLAISRYMNEGLDFRQILSELPTLHDLEPAKALQLHENEVHHIESFDVPRYWIAGERIMPLDWSQWLEAPLSRSLKRLKRLCPRELAGHEISICSVLGNNRHAV